MSPASALAPRPFHLPSFGDGPFLGPLCRAMATATEALLSFPQLNHVYASIDRSGRPEAFCAEALKVLRVTWEVSDEDLARIPKTGPLIVVANHPFGGVDGVLFTALLQRVRPDVRLLANHFLSVIPEMASTSIFVDPFGGAKATIRNIGAIKSAVAWVEQGGVLAIFPAGEVSHLTFKNGCVTDPPWNSAVGRIARRTGAPVVPVFFSGRNTNLFQLAGLLHPRLRTVMLPRELLKKRGQRVSIRIGHPIHPRRFARFENPADLTEYLRLRTYLLKGRATTDSGGAPPRALRRRALAPVAPETDAGRIADEIAALPGDHLLADNDPLCVYLAERNEAPLVVAELGRLRELTFRAIGEGTGQPRDLDRFDDDYLHLFVWQRKERRIVGGYRMGQTDRVLARRGPEGLYTSTLFDFKPQLLEQINPALELGRSFVIADYQKSFTPLMLLWKGIGRFLSRQPRYRRLFGAVSISDEFQSMTRQLLLAFLRTDDLRSALADFVTPKNPPRQRRFRHANAGLLATVVRDISEVDELVSEIESDKRHIPVLLRQYLKLNAKMLGFNIDRNFGDVLDGLVVVDVTKVERNTLNRYFGREEAEKFLEYHGSVVESPTLPR